METCSRSETARTVSEMETLKCVFLLYYLGLAAAIVHNKDFKKELTEGSYCNLNQGGLGVCEEKDDCEGSANVEKGMCSGSLVCCPPPGEKSRQKCKEYSKIEASTHCAGAHPLRAQPKEFPHVALVGFGNIAKTSWDCMGSLISKNYVLTSAACVEDIGSTGPAARVRLGDLDREIESANVQYVTVEKTISHPLYSNRTLYHDIALIKLAKDVEFNEYIRPTCLHTYKEIPRSKGLLVGWGGYHSSGNKRVDLKVEIPFVTGITCKKDYGITKLLPRGMDEEIIVCAGQEGKSSCGGDTGVPLQVKRNGPGCTYDLVGVSTIGNSDCIQGNQPGGFARVSYYVPWIESIVWE